jgi:phage antirepressor YoqD-like protein
MVTKNSTPQHRIPRNAGEMATLTSSLVTMTSREIAELTDKRHTDVKRDIENMLRDLGEDTRNFARIYFDTMNREQTEFALDRELTETLLTGYSSPLRRKVIARWRQLESLERIVPGLPNFADPATAARAWADQVDARRQLQIELDAAKSAVEFVERYVDSTGFKSFRQVAKLLSANEHEFRQYLIDDRVMYKLGGEWTPFAQHLEAGRFEVRAGTSQHNSHTFHSARFTPKGVTWVAGEFAKWKLKQRDRKVT